MYRSRLFQSLVVVALVILSGCGDPGGGDTNVRALSSSSTLQVPARMGSGAQVATSAHLVSLSGDGQDPFGEVVDLRTGAIEDVVGPEGRDLHVIRYEATADRVIMVGFLGDAGDEYDPLPVERVSYSFDPSSRHWTELVLPSELSEKAADVRVELAPGGPTGMAGVFGVGDGPFVLATVDQEGWTPVGTVDAETGEQRCATDDAWYSLGAIVTDGGTPEAPYPSNIRLVETRFEDGDGTDIALPPLRADVGAADVALGCTRSSTLIMTGSSGEPPPRLCARRGGNDWEAIAAPPDDSPSWTSPWILSDPSSVLVVYARYDPAKFDVGSVEALVISDDGTVRQFTDDLRDRSKMWSRGSGSLILVGPLSGDTDESDEASVDLTLLEAN